MNTHYLFYNRKTETLTLRSIPSLIKCEFSKEFENVHEPSVDGLYYQVKEVGKEFEL
jgi:hypothetical protein